MGEIQVPPHWKEVYFGEVCNLRKEPVQPTDDPDIAYVGLEHIDPGHPKLTRTGTASEVKSSKSKFYFGDILYGKLRPYLDKAVLADFEGICSTDILVFKVNGLIKPEFLTYLIHTKAFINHAIRTTRGVNHPRTSWASLVQFYFPLPPLPEQKTIAHTLQTIQKAKETHQRELELERERKAALMQYLFTDGTCNEPRKQTKVGEIPNSWKVIKLGQICESSAYGPRFSGNLYNPNGTIATLRTTDIDKDGNINYSTMPFASLELHKFKNHLIEIKDLLITRSGTCGIAAVFESYNSPVIPGAFLIRFRLNEYAEPYFLRYYINSHLGRKRITQLASGAVQKNISGTSLLNWLIPLPTIPEQLKIVGILRTCDRKIQALEKEIALTDELFHAMLEQLMIGKISTQPLTETYV